MPSDERNNFAQIERAEKHRLEPMAMQKPRRLNEASERDDVATLRKHERRGRWSLATRSGCNGDGLGGRVEHAARLWAWLRAWSQWSMVLGYGLGGRVAHGARLWAWRPCGAYPATIGSSERKMRGVTRSPGRQIRVRRTVAMGSPALIVSTNDAFTLPKEPFVRQKPTCETWRQGR